jgi:RNA-dependent RNA polymerase
VKSPWEEFDREEEALQKSPYGGLGFDENNNLSGWHGGRVLFHAKLHDMARDRKSCTPQYKLTLEPAELSSSHSFARRFGSKHFLRMKLTKGVINKHSKHLLDYIRRPLILCGSVFRAFFAKEGNVFYVKTNEGTDGKSILLNVSVPNVMSFLEFINWHNPIELNSKQVSESLWIGKDFPSERF